MVPKFRDKRFRGGGRAGGGPKPEALNSTLSPLLLVPVWHMANRAKQLKDVAIVVASY